MDIKSDNYSSEVLERIRTRAHEIWEYRQEFQVYLIVTKYGQYQNLTTQDDWLEAEKEVMAGLEEK